MKLTFLAAALAGGLLSAPALAADKTNAPVTLINTFTVPAGMEEEAIAFWDKAAAFMR